MGRVSETIQERVRRVIRESPERAWGLDAVADLAFIERCFSGIPVDESGKLDAVADLAFIERAGAGRP